MRTQDDRDGAALRAEVAAAGLTFVGDARVWSVTGRFRVDAATETGTQAYVAPRLVAATGAHERVVPFPGWTLPGVIGLAAATILLKSEAMLPGRRTVVAGCGPLLDHMGLFHAVLSYHGGISVTVTACRDMLPDPDFYTECIQASFDELKQAAEALGRSRARALQGRRPRARKATAP